MESITKLLILILVVIAIADGIKDFSNKPPKSNYKYLKNSIKNEEETVEEYKAEIINNGLEEKTEF